ncbi:hypothetical protein ASPFODRAFT_53446, partial [Aspergillus luchuensis CBS 106.47]
MRDHHRGEFFCSRASWSQLVPTASCDRRYGILTATANRSWKVQPTTETELHVLSHRTGVIPRNLTNPMRHKPATVRTF